MRILIIGAGIAGSAAALALHQAGFEPTVHEAHPDNGEDLGAFLTLASNGMRALGQIGAARPVADRGFPLTALRLLDATGTELAKTAIGDPDDPLTRYRCLRRADLAAVLQQEVRRRGIPLTHGARLSTIAEDASTVTATFTNGRTATGDLLVGADGLNSAVRTLTSPTEPHYAGQKVFYGYTTEAAQLTPTDTITMIRGTASAFGYTHSPTGETFWFARITGSRATATELATTTPDQWRNHLLGHLHPDTTPAAPIVEATTNLMATNALDLPPSIPWHTPRTLLIGDAAHAASPATGQGASMALEDAVILAKALRDVPTTHQALTTFDHVRRPRVEHNIAASAALSAGRTPPRSNTTPQPPSLTDEELIRQLDWATPLVRCHAGSDDQALTPDSA